MDGPNGEKVKAYGHALQLPSLELGGYDLLCQYPAFRPRTLSKSARRTRTHTHTFSFPVTTTLTLLYILILIRWNTRTCPCSTDLSEHLVGSVSIEEDDLGILERAGLGPADDRSWVDVSEEGVAGEIYGFGMGRDRLECGGSG